MQVNFSPPQAFLSVASIESMEVDDDGNLDSVSSTGGRFFYLLDDELVSLLKTKKVEFSFI